MENLNGTPLKKFNINLSFTGDLLIKDDEAIITHFVNEHQEDFLRYFVDSNRLRKRWIYFKINPGQLYHFLNKDISFKDVFESCPDGFVYAADEDKKGKLVSLVILGLKEVPKAYIPTRKMKYDPKKYEEYTYDLKKLSEVCAKFS